jgi:serine/threonine protein kinase
MRVVQNRELPEHDEQTPSLRRPWIGGSFLPGEILDDRYRIVRFIASGGMGEVYEALDQVLGQRVALKTLQPQLAQNDPITERFRREIHLARKVTHPNVCRVFDSAVHSGAPYGPGQEPAGLLFLTMELLEGETLSRRLRRCGPMSEQEALPLVRQMVGALRAAHDVGVVHRDFKSSNVLLVPAAEAPAASGTAADSRSPPCATSASSHASSTTAAS